MKHLKASKRVLGCGAEADHKVCGESCRNLVKCNRKSTAPKSSITVLILMWEYADCFAIEYLSCRSCSESSPLSPSSSLSSLSSSFLLDTAVSSAR